MKKMIAVLGLVALVACSGSTVTGPTPVPDSGANVATSSTPAPAPPVAAPPVGTPSFEGKILAFAGWDVKNTSGNISRMTAYKTSFDNQSLPVGPSKVYTVQPGDSFRDTFDTTCVQVDITYGDAGDAPFLFGYIDNEGNVVGRINDEIRKACTPKPPEEPVCTVNCDRTPECDDDEKVVDGKCVPKTCEELGNCPVDCVGDFVFDGAKQSAECGVNSYKWDSYTYHITTPAANGGDACLYADGYNEERSKTPWTCPVTCALTVQPPTHACYSNATSPWGDGNQGSDICSKYGLKDIGKDYGTPTRSTFQKAARLAVIHFGNGPCSGGEQLYGFRENVVPSQGFGPQIENYSWSFTQYCGCN